MKKPISRRDFLGHTAAAGAAGILASRGHAETKPIPTRVLGKTGVRIPMIAMGCGSRFLAYGNPDAAIQALNLAIDSGITYLDTAYGYGSGKSETWVGEVMKTRRKEVFLATKINARKPDDVKKILDGTFKRLQTDRVDLIHVHSLTDEADLAAVEAKGGVLETLLSLRDQKVTRFVGMTSHTDPTVLRTAIERHDIDCVQMALNAALQGMRNGSGKMVLNPDMKTSFEDVALPAARTKNLGILGMKMMGQEDLIGTGPGKTEPAALFRYTLSLPIAACVIGMPQLEHIRQNASWARSFRPMARQEMKRLALNVAAASKLALDRKFEHHIDA